MSETIKKLLVGLIITLGVLSLVCCTTATVGLVAYSLLTRRIQEVSLPPIEITRPRETAAPSLVPPPESVQAEEETLKVSPSLSGSTNDRLLGARQTMATIQQEQIPQIDWIDLAQRVFWDQPVPRELPIVPRTITPPTRPPQVGDADSFWLLDTDNNLRFQIQARLVYVTDHLYFWIEEGLRYNQRDLIQLADTFNDQIYPTNRQFFGSEWSPGVDGDPRVHILYAAGLGKLIAGYFSSADEYPAQVNEFSNEREIFLLNADTINLSAKHAYTTLAHELQHMIHWNQDRNEETWLNEGFSDLAAFINGYEIGGSDRIYLQAPDLQLNDWPSEPDVAHYGASFLFLTYFLDRFGEGATQAVVANPANGLASIDQVLNEFGFKDRLTGEQIDVDDLFADWTATNYLQDRRAGDGRFYYYTYPGAPKALPTETIKECQGEQEEGLVHQYGVDYIRIRCKGDFLLQFSGESLASLLPLEPYSGNFVFWSNRSEESDTTLTRSFDFSEVNGPLTLSYWAWFDMEVGYDYVYVLASEDDGETWQILPTPAGTDFNPAGNNLGWAYTGISGSDSSKPTWTQERVDLSRLAGKKVLLRFQYLTDAAVTGEGFVLDDIEIPEIDYRSDFEEDSGGWEGQGFVRVQNALPQTYRLSLIESGSNTRVTHFDYAGEDVLEIPFQIGDQVKEVTLVVSGITRVTRQEAPYSFRVIPAP